MGKSWQMDNLVRSSICSFAFCATVLKFKITWKKPAILKMCKLQIWTLQKFLVSLWPLPHMNHYKSLITCSHTVFHWTSCWAVAGYSVFLFLSFRETWFNTFHPNWAQKIVLDEPVMFPPLSLRVTENDISFNLVSMILFFISVFLI